MFLLPRPRPRLMTCDFWMRRGFFMFLRHRGFPVRSPGTDEEFPTYLSHGEGSHAEASPLRGRGTAIVLIWKSWKIPEKRSPRSHCSSWGSLACKIVVIEDSKVRQRSKEIQSFRKKLECQDRCLLHGPKRLQVVPDVL